MTKQSAPSVTVIDQVVAAILLCMERAYLKNMWCFPPNGSEQGGLTSLQLQVIVSLSRGARQMGDIAVCVGVSPATGTRTIGSLVALGFIRRWHGRGDRRVVRCSLTPKGSQQLEKFWDMSRRRLQKAMQPFSDEELATIPRAMEILMGVLFDEGVPLPVEP